MTTMQDAELRRLAEEQLLDRDDHAMLLAAETVLALLDRAIEAERRLGEVRSLAKMGAFYQHIERFGIMPKVPHGDGTWRECENERCVAALAALSETPDES